MKVFAGALIALAAIFVLGGLLLPSRVHIERTRMLSARPQAIYPLLANLRDGWPKWSPFGKAHDPDLKETFTGPQSGAGATESWTGGSMPAGHLTITRADPASGVDFRIEMSNGAKIEGHIAMQPQGPGTRVIWADDADLGHGLLAGWFGLMLRATLGPTEEKALAQLETAAR